jgi:REP element-mobilizing transposase RayT
MRKPRELEDGADYHVTARSNRSEMLFEEDPCYKELLLQYVEKAKKKYDFEIQNICVMGNHIHMIIRPGKGSRLCDIMKSILGGFARRYNIINNLKGHVWYDRFKSKVIHQMQQFFNTFAYISNNPVRAMIVPHPWDYKYSAIYGYCLQEDSPLKKLLDSIVDYSAVEYLFHQMIETYTPVTARRIDTSIGFYDRKPGRPKKENQV